MFLWYILKPFKIMYIRSSHIQVVEEKIILYDISQQIIKVNKADCLTTPLPDNCLMTTWRLSNDCPTTSWWLADDCLMTAWRLSDHSHCRKKLREQYWALLNKSTPLIRFVALIVTFWQFFFFNIRTKYTRTFSYSQKIGLKLLYQAPNWANFYKSLWIAV